MDLTEPELRVAGCLVEKSMTTPDSYPLTLNALITACNQRSNRNPVVDYDDGTVIRAIDGLRDRGWIRLLRSPGQRAVKYKHVLGEMLELDEHTIAILAVLMLRGDQTPGELRARTDRYVEFAHLAQVETTLDQLTGRSLARRLARRPGEKESRYRQLVGAATDEEIEPETEPSHDPTQDRLTTLEAEVARLGAELTALRAALGEP